jgi:predicted metal-dependent hydrolase
MRSRIQLGDIGVDVVRKDIKNVHLSVHPPTRRVRIAAPERMSLETVRVFAIAKLPSRNSSRSCVSKNARSPVNTSTGNLTTSGDRGIC